MAQVCPKCGEELEDRAKFCTNCGTTLKKEEEILEEEEVNEEYLEEFGEIEEDDEVDISSLSEAPPIEAEPIKSTEMEIETTPIIEVPIADNNINEKKPSALQQMPEIVHEEKTQPPIIEEKIDDGEYHPVISQSKAKGQTKDIKKTVLGVFIKVAIVFFIVAISIAGYSLYTSYRDAKANDKDGIPEKIGNIDAYRVGSADFGYLSLPTTWQAFKTEEGGETLQYSDGTGWIITLYATPMETITPTKYTETIVENMNQRGASDVKAEKTTISKYNGFKITGYYKDVNVYITAWIFDGKDSKSHYISIEGPGLLTEDNSYYEIPKSFRTDK